MSKHRPKDVLDYVCETQQLSFEEAAALLELGQVLDRQGPRFWKGVQLLQRSLYATHMDASMHVQGKARVRLLGQADAATSLEADLRAHSERVRAFHQAFLAQEFEDDQPTNPDALEE